MSGAAVVVVGAGIGGLCAAIDLALAGQRVQVFEQHAAPGGKMRQLYAGERPLDAGPTVFTMRWVFDALFAAAGRSLDEALRLHRAELLARHSWMDGSRLDLFADIEQSVAAIETFATPREGAAYRAFVRESARIFDTLDHSFMRAQRPGPLALAQRVGWRRLPDLLATRPFVTLWRALGQRFADPRLRQLFGRYATYTGSSPFQAPATLMLIAEAERRGVWQIDGGMQALAQALARLLEDCGGELHLNTPVAEICVAGARACGVRLADGRQLSADAVLFNGDVAALRDGRLGPPACSAVAARGTGAGSLSAVTWGMQAVVSGWALGHHTVLFGDDYADEFDSIFSQQRVAAAPTLYLCAQDRGELHAPPVGAERLFCLMNAPGRDLTAAELERCEQQLQASFSAHGLGVVPLTGSLWRQTPADFAARFPSSKGALYGRATHGWLGSFARGGARSRLRGLYLAGAGVHPGAGVPMVATSGRLAAAQLLADLR